MRFCCSLLFGLLLAASHARAADGVLEINHTCAVQTGCFAGDTAGYPITITTPGTSSVLTSPLIVPDENTDGIVVSTSSLTIDLNGFEIVCSGCEGAILDCTPVSGLGSGVERTSPTNRGIAVKNGSVTGMGNYGVLLGDQAEATGLRVRWNRVDGIYTGPGSTVSGNTAYFNSGDGISTGSGTTVQRHTVRVNGGYALNLGAQSAYRENVITSNTNGTVKGEINMFSNSCNATTTCP